MRELAQKINPTPEEVREILEDPASATVGDTFRGRLLKILDLATYQLQQPLEDVDRRVLDYLRAEQPQGMNLDAYFARFEAFDMVTLPLTYPDLEEVNPVDIVRIAPRGRDQPDRRGQRG